MSLCYLIKLIEQCYFGSQISKSSSDIRNRNRLKLSRSHGLLHSLLLSNIWTVIDRWIEHKFTTQNWSQVLINIDVSHNLLINPYPPHVAERGLLKTPHPHKAVHVVYLQSLEKIFESQTDLLELMVFIELKKSIFLSKFTYCSFILGQGLFGLNRVKLGYEGPDD